MGVVMVFLDHCRKPGFREGTVPRKEQLLGSQDKVASIESLIMLRSETGSNEVSVYQNKCRNHIEYKPFKIEITDSVDDFCNITKVELKYAGLIEEKEYKIDQAKDAILELLSEGKKRRKEITEILADQKMGSRNVSEGLRNLEKEGKIYFVKVGREHEFDLAKNHETDAEAQKEFDKLL
jgi:PHD/YefM family antitoxin component YafN of YafNO toxin-antitoxin module